MISDKAKFSSEAMLCLTFIRQLPPGWKAYPETCGFDIVLVRDDGVQVGVEAKLTLNAKVIQQAAEEGAEGWYSTAEGPDFRAVLVPWNTTGSLSPLCKYLGITVIEMMDKAIYQERNRYWTRPDKETFRPQLPELPDKEWMDDRYWTDRAPAKRLTLPDYVPDVAAGRSGPTKLTIWKVKAIKIAILVAKRGFVTRHDFKAIGLDHRRWLERHSGWLVVGERRGEYVAGPHIGVFKRSHPRNYLEIEADIEKWEPKPPEA